MMVGIVGYQDDVIGFGLTGITEMVELTKGASKEEVLDAVLSLKDKVEAIIINESLLNAIRDHKQVKEIFFVEIPEDKVTVNAEDIERLARETLGISL